jgi:hypothetical protein
MSADDFMTDDGNAEQARDQPELNVEVAALLRARHDLTENDRELLQDVFQSALKHIRTSSDRP